MKYYVDFEGWGVVEANSKEEAIERFCDNVNVISITYDDITAEESEEDKR